MLPHRQPGSQFPPVEQHPVPGDALPPGVVLLQGDVVEPGPGGQHGPPSPVDPDELRLDRLTKPGIELRFILLMPGNGFVYAGSESYQTKDTPLFEKEVIARDFDACLVAYITRLNQLKNQMSSETIIDVMTFTNGECLRIEVETLKRNYVFLINFGDEPIKIKASGINLLTNQVVENGTIELSEGVFFIS